MRFLTRVEVADVSDGFAAVARSESLVELVPRSDLVRQATAAGTPCGMWAFEALRIARGEPRLGLDTDSRTIPNEVGWIGTAVHLNKGCYRGQETVARIHNLGRPPRRLVRLHLDGSVDVLPGSGAAVELAGRQVGFVGSAARHYELGPIALALVKRNVDATSELLAGGVAAAQEVLVDPDVGLHVRARL
jgi:tRNA-modifying protein YgfZ